MRQRRAPPSGPGGRPIGRDDDPHGARSGARPAGAADACGNAGAGHSGRTAGPRDRRGKSAGAARGGARWPAAGERDPARSDRAGLHHRADVGHRARLRPRPRAPVGATRHAVTILLNLAARRQPSGTPLAPRHRRHRAGAGADAARRSGSPARELSRQPARAGWIRSGRAGRGRSEPGTRPLLAADCRGCVPNRYDAEDRVRQHGSRAAATHARRSSGSRVFYFTADRRAESRHQPGSTGAEKSRAGRHRGLPAGHNGLLPRARCDRRAGTRLQRSRHHRTRRTSRS